MIDRTEIRRRLALASKRMWVLANEKKMNRPFEEEVIQACRENEVLDFWYLLSLASQWGNDLEQWEKAVLTGVVEPINGGVDILGQSCTNPPIIPEDSVVQG